MLVRQTYLYTFLIVVAQILLTPSSLQDLSQCIGLHPRWLKAQFIRLIQAKRIRKVKRKIKCSVSHELHYSERNNAPAPENNVVVVVLLVK